MVGTTDQDQPLKPTVFKDRPRVAILGSKGRLGAALTHLWRPVAEILPYCREKLDISRLQDVEKLVTRIPCEFVINCTGLTNVDNCENDPKEAFLLNASSPALMARICSARGIHFIHFSTDYVFDGKHPKLLTEEDPAQPISHYGSSKLEGEMEVLRAGQTALRVSWVFGPDKPSFVDQILQRALTEDQIEAVADKTSCPTYTHDLAEWMKIFLSNEIKGNLFHLCNSGACSWREYGQHAIDCALEYGMPLKARRVLPLKMDEVRAFKAKRPCHTAMSTGKFAALWGQPLRSWKDAVREYVRIFKAHQELEVR
ncbi:MAG: dTDP-4-dehydrorhamnose reductase [Verrucomicrobia bacterium]|nr:MAG: dTDP-4-dehydrorhamnose reductase [Verrucomicrobiota bacterium]